VSRKRKGRNVVEEQKCCRGGAVSRKNMNNIKEKQEEEQCRRGIGTMLMKNRRRSAIEKQQ